MRTWPKKATIGDLYNPIVDVKTEEEAKDYLESLIQWAVTEHGQTREKAEEIQRTNVGYYAGYFDHETFDRIIRLFGVSHPIFGKEYVTGDTALQAGVAMAKEDHR